MHKIHRSLLVLTTLLLSTALSGCMAQIGDEPSALGRQEQAQIEPNWNQALIAHLEDGGDIFAWVIVIDENAPGITLTDGTNTNSLSDDREYWFNPTANAGSLSAQSDIDWVVDYAGDSEDVEDEANARIDNGEFGLNEVWNNDQTVVAGDWTSGSYSAPQGATALYFEATIDGRDIGLWVEQDSSDDLQNIVWTQDSTTDPMLPTKMTPSTTVITFSSASDTSSYYYDSNG